MQNIISESFWNDSWKIIFKKKNRSFFVLREILRAQEFLISLFLRHKLHQNDIDYAHDQID